MVIDDDNIMVKLLEKQLGSAGHKIIGNLSCEGALKRLEMETPDLIILDLMFDGIDGIGIARQIRERANTEKTPIVFITAAMDVKSDKGDGKLVIGKESFPIFAKPVHVPKLLATIRKALNRIENSQKS